MKGSFVAPLGLCLRQLPLNIDNFGLFFPDLKNTHSETSTFAYAFECNIPFFQLSFFLPLVRGLVLERPPQCRPDGPCRRLHRLLSKSWALCKIKMNHKYQMSGKYNVHQRWMMLFYLSPESTAIATDAAEEETETPTSEWTFRGPTSKISPVKWNIWKC